MKWWTSNKKLPGLQRSREIWPTVGRKISVNCNWPRSDTDVTITDKDIKLAITTLNICSKVKYRHGSVKETQVEYLEMKTTMHIEEYTGLKAD